MKKSNIETLNRRTFISSTGAAVAGAMFLNPLELLSGQKDEKKMRIAIVGTGVRALGMWSHEVLKSYGSKVEFVGLCDVNPGRVEYLKKRPGLRALLSSISRR
jgi:hypothetical protein